MKKRFGFDRHGFLCYIAFYGLKDEKIPEEIGVWKLYRKFFVNLFALPIGFLIGKVRDNVESLSVILLHGIGVTLLSLVGVVVFLAAAVTLSIAATALFGLVFGLVFVLAILLVVFHVLGLLFAARPPRASDGEFVRNDFLVPFRRWPKVSGYRVYPVWILAAALFGFYGFRIALLSGAILWILYGLVRFFGSARYGEHRALLYERIFPTARIVRREEEK